MSQRLLLSSVFLALVGLGLTSALRAEGPEEPAPRAAEPACQRWEVTIWEPEAAGCRYLGDEPRADRDEWCRLPALAEPLGPAPAGGLWVRRCAARF